MARDPPKVPKKPGRGKTPLVGNRDPYTSSSASGGSDNNEDLLGSDIEREGAADEIGVTGNSGNPGSDPKESDNDDDEEAVKVADPTTDDRSMIVMWYEQTLDLKVEVAKALHNKQDLKTPEHWASLTDKSINTMVKQSQGIPICQVDKLKLLAFACRHADRTS